MTDEFQGPIAGALQHQVEELLDQAPATKGGTAEITATKDGVSGEVDANLGKGWSVGAAGSWMRKQGWAIAAKAKARWGAK